MQRNDRWPSDYDPDPRSRRNSGSSRGSRKGKKSPPASATSTPKKVVKPQNLDFVVTGKQILKRPDRANSLPGSNRRRPSLEAVKPKKPASPKRLNESPSNSRETSLEDDMSLDLSQVSDFEDMNSKYGIRTSNLLATSTPKQKRASLPLQASDRSRQKSGEKGGWESRDTLFKTNSSLSYRHGVSTDLDYSSVSPEYSGQSSTEVSPRQTKPVSGDVSSYCVSNWVDGSDGETKEDQKRSNGEWNSFWVNYSGSVAKIPLKSYYDQCPTPYRTEDIDPADLDFSAEGSRKRSPEDTKNLNSIIRNEGLHLTPRETQNIIKCAHILGNVLTKAIGRRSKDKEQNTDKIQELQVEQTEKDEEKELKKKNMTLDLKETNIPVEVKEEKRSETVTTQTDISLPNTKSAPRIFESILRQLSRSSIDEGLVKKAKESLESENSEVKKDT
ncbi:uncharacterized protein [Choristoneura fumiferana]|uniref:uncharacterized protein n=1 Tax=Choristoneura fumiferana TaxID=7141 RepID=UPI003D155C33